MYRTEIITYYPLSQRDIILNSFLEEGFEYFNTVQLTAKDTFKEIITLKQIKV